MVMSKERFNRAVQNLHVITRGLIAPPDLQRSDTLLDLTNGKYSGGQARFTEEDFEPRTQTAVQKQEPAPIATEVSDITVINIFCDRRSDAQKLINTLMIDKKVLGKNMLIKCTFNDDFMTQRWEYNLTGILHTYMIHWCRPTRINCLAEKGTVAYVHRGCENINVPLLISIESGHQQTLWFGGEGDV